MLVVIQLDAGECTQSVDRALTTIQRKRVQKDKIKVNFEKLFYSLKGNPDVAINDQIKDDVKYIFRKFTTNRSRVCSMRTNQALHKTLLTLANDSSIKVCKFNKSNGVAKLNTNDYNAKMEAIVGDTGVARNFDWGGPKWKDFMTLFCDVISVT